MLVIADAPFIVMRFVMPALSVATAAGMVTAGITVGVIVSKNIDAFTNTKIVLQSSGSIVTNRFIEPNELALFYNVLQTMDVFVADVKSVLTAKFGEKFVNVELTTFTPTPVVTSNNETQSASRKKRFTPNEPGGSPLGRKLSTPSTGDDGSKPTGTYDSESTGGYGSESTGSTPYDNCTLIIKALYCGDTSDRIILNCNNQTVSITNCTSVGADVLKCIDMVVPNCTWSGYMNEAVICNSQEIKVLSNCSNRWDANITSPAPNTNSATSTTTNTRSTTTSTAPTSDSTASTNTTRPSTTNGSKFPTTTLASTTSNPTSTGTASASTTNSPTSTTTASASTVAATTTSFDSNTNQPVPPANATVRRSIITSNMFIYFAVTPAESESILVSDIIDALNNLNPSIILMTVRQEPSPQPSSFNKTLSKVEPPTKVDKDLSALASQSGIPSSLQDSVNEAAQEALAIAKASGLFSDETTSGTTPGIIAVTTAAKTVVKTETSTTTDVTGEVV